MLGSNLGQQVRRVRGDGPASLSFELVDESLNLAFVERWHFVALEVSEARLQCVRSRVGRGVDGLVHGGPLVKALPLALPCVHQNADPVIGVEVRQRRVEGNCPVAGGILNDDECRLVRGTQLGGRGREGSRVRDQVATLLAVDGRAGIVATVPRGGDLADCRGLAGAGTANEVVGLGRF